MASSATNETLLRELLAGHAGLAEKVEGLAGRINAVQSDAREARDAARDSAAATRAQDIPAEMEKLRGQIEKIGQAGRSDLMNSISKVTAELRKGHDDHEDRIKRLEAVHNRFDGATGLLGWLSRHAPWLVALIISTATYLGLKGGHQP